MSWLRVCFFLLVGGLTSVARAYLVEHGPWLGAITSHSATLVAVLNSPRKATLEVSEQSYFSRIISVGTITAVPGNLTEVQRFRIRGLTPNTRYYYRLRAGTEIDDINQGTFVTLPPEGNRATFSFAFASGAKSGSEHPVYAEIRRQKPLVFIQVGELHTGETDADERTRYRHAFDRVLSSTNQRELQRSTPIAYVWGPRDFAAADTPFDSTLRLAAHATYREYVPHYPLAPAGVPDSHIAQAFSIGRVRIILLDTESQRSAAGPTTVLGPEQLAWLKRELRQAAIKHPLIFLVTPAPWLDDADAAPDAWSRASAERDALAEWLHTEKINHVCILSGGAPMLAADDGTHNRFGPYQAPGTPVLHAGPLDLPARPVDGTWSVPPILPKTGEGQFGLVSITDADGALSVLFRGLNEDGREKCRLAFRVNAP